MTQKVNIYTLSTCSHCKATKKFLDENNIEYSCSEVDQLQGEERSAVLEEVKKLNPRLSFPTIIIGDTIIVGFKEGEIREALGI